MADILPHTMQYDTKHCNYKELPLFLAIFLKTRSLELACIALCPFPNTMCVYPLHGCLSIPCACIHFICVYPLSTSCVCIHCIPAHVFISCACNHFLCLYPFCVHVSFSCACIHFLCLHLFHVRVSISCILVSISCACIHFMSFYICS